MAEQFDWSKVLERMKEESEPATSAGKPNQPEVADKAPAPEPFVMDVHVVAPPAVQPGSEPAAAVVAEEPEKVEDPLAWDEDDIPAPVAIQPEKPKPVTLDPVITLDWDDDRVTEASVQEREATVDLVEEAPSVEGPVGLMEHEVATFPEESVPEPIEAEAAPTIDAPQEPEAVVVEANPVEQTLVPTVPPTEPVINGAMPPAPDAAPPVLEQPPVMVVEAVPPPLPVAQAEPPAVAPAPLTAAVPPPLPDIQAPVPPEPVTVATSPQPPVIEFKEEEPASEARATTLVAEEPRSEPPLSGATEEPVIVAEAPPAEEVDEPRAVVDKPKIKLLATPFDREPEVKADAVQTSASEEKPKIILLATPFDPDPHVPEETVAQVEAEVPPMPAEPPAPESTAAVGFSMADLDDLKAKQAIADQPTPPAVKAEAKKASKPKREEKVDEPELKLVKRDGPTSFGLSDKRLGSALLDVKAITRKQLEEGLAQQVETAEPLGRILVRKGYVSIAKVLQVVAIQRGIDAWDLEADPPKPEAMGLVTGETCQRYGVLPVAVRGDLLVLAMVEPDDAAAIECARTESNMRVQPVLADPERLASLVQRNYHLDARASSVMDSLVTQALKTANESGHTRVNERNTLTEEETRPVVGFVNQIIHDAIRMHASDIHIEPRFDHAEIRYRLDGQLMTMREVPQALVPMVTTRLKIMAELDIVEYRVPQDGRMALQFGKSSIDLRVSCLPSLHGQRIVMRVLDKSFGLRRLDELGFDPENLTILRSLVEKPYGLLFATGPTGSGKTTTLYAAIQEMRREGQNVMTCEDPVEYDLEGVNQSQVNERVGLTFAEQLRAILRQDPDIVLVGEVRDHETAETAVRAAMTGHMVLSTLHCNDAPSAIARLLDLGVDPFLLSTSLIGSMSQRLVRKLCPACRREEEPTPEEVEMMARHFGVEGVDRIWRAIGCDKCHNTGYKGRVAVSEIMPVVEEIAALIAARAPLEQIRTAAGLYGYLPMQADAMVRVARGETSLDEARRTVFFDTIQKRDKPRSIAV